MSSLPSASDSENCTELAPIHNLQELATPHISDELYNIVVTVINCFCVPIIGGLGLVGSISTLIVLKRNGLQEMSNRLLFSLAVSDSCVQVLMLVRQVEFILFHFDEALASDISAYVVTYCYLPSRFFTACSASHIPVIAIERFVVVYFPLKASSWLTVRSAMISIAAIYSSWAVLISPFWGGFEVDWVFSEARNKTVPVTVHSEYALDNVEEFTLYNGAFLSVYAGPFMFFVVFFCAIAIWRKLRQGRNKRDAMTQATAGMKNRSKIEAKVTRMLLAVCFAFLITGMPNVGVFLYMLTVPEVLLNRFFWFVSTFIDFFSLINSAVNVFIYTFMSTKFRNTLVDLLLCRQDSRRSNV